MKKILKKFVLLENNQPAPQCQAKRKTLTKNLKENVRVFNTINRARYEYFQSHQ